MHGHYVNSAGAAPEPDFVSTGRSGRNKFSVLTLVTALVGIVDGDSEMGAAPAGSYTVVPWCNACSCPHISPLCKHLLAARILLLHTHKPAERHGEAEVLYWRSGPTREFASTLLQTAVKDVTAAPDAEAIALAASGLSSKAAMLLHHVALCLARVDDGISEGSSAVITLDKSLEGMLARLTLQSGATLKAPGGRHSGGVLGAYRKSARDAETVEQDRAQGTELRERATPQHYLQELTRAYPLPQIANPAGLASLPSASFPALGPLLSMSSAISPAPTPLSVGMRALTSINSFAERAAAAAARSSKASDVEMPSAQCPEPVSLSRSYAMSAARGMSPSAAPASLIASAAPVAPAAPAGANSAASPPAGRKHPRGLPRASALLARLFSMLGSGGAAQMQPAGTRARTAGGLIALPTSARWAPPVPQVQADFALAPSGGGGEGTLTASESALASGWRGTVASEASRLRGRRQGARASAAASALVAQAAPHNERGTMCEPPSSAVTASATAERAAVITSPSPADAPAAMSAPPSSAHVPATINGRKRARSPARLCHLCEASTDEPPRAALRGAVICITCQEPCSCSAQRGEAACSSCFSASQLLPSK